MQRAALYASDPDIGKAGVDVMLPLFPFRVTVPVAEYVAQTSSPFRSEHLTVTVSVQVALAPFPVSVCVTDELELDDVPKVQL